MRDDRPGTTRDTESWERPPAETAAFEPASRPRPTTSRVASLRPARTPPPAPPAPASADAEPAAAGAVDAWAAWVHLAAGYQFREKGVAGHIRRVASYVEVIARVLGLPEDEVQRLVQASLRTTSAWSTSPRPSSTRRAR